MTKNWYDPRDCEWGASTFGKDCPEPKTKGTRFCEKHLALILKAGEKGK